MPLSVVGQGLPVLGVHLPILYMTSQCLRALPGQTVRVFWDPLKMQLLDQLTNSVGSSVSLMSSQFVLSSWAAREIHILPMA